MELTTDLRRYVRFYLESTNATERDSLEELLNTYGFRKPALDAISVLYETKGLRSVYTYLSSYNDPENDQN
jgi:hypothetical protein